VQEEASQHCHPLSANNVEEAYRNGCGTLLYAHHSLVPRPCPALLPYSKLGWGLIALFPGPAQPFVACFHTASKQKLGRLGSEDMHSIDPGWTIGICYGYNIWSKGDQLAILLWTVRGTTSDGRVSTAQQTNCGRSYN